MKQEIRDEFNRNINKKKLGVDYKHFIIYISIFTIGIIALSLSYIFYTNIVEFWEQVLINLACGMMVTSVFAFLIDYINNYNYLQKLKLKRINVLSKLQKELNFYIFNNLQYIKNYKDILEIMELTNTQINNPKIIFLKLIEMFNKNRSQQDCENNYEATIFLNSIKSNLSNTMNIKTEIETIIKQVDFLEHLDIFSYNELLFMSRSSNYYKNTLDYFDCSTILQNIISFSNELPEFKDLLKGDKNETRD